MATKIEAEILTPTTVSDELNGSMLRAFRRLRQEHGLGTDEATANLAGLPGTYVHWVTFRQPWSLKGIVLVAAALNCTVAEMLRLAGDGREVAP